MNHKQASRSEWDGATTIEAINSGSLQRIADATEKMAASYDSVRNDRDFWKGAAERGQAREQRLNNRIRALRGVITRMKRGSNV